MLNKYFFPIVVIIFAIILFVSGFVLGICCDPKWFGSFGSIVVLLGAISEYNLIQNELRALYDSLKGQGAAQCGNEGIPDLNPERKHKVLSFASHITIAIGTLTWGFGEFLLDYVIN